jgi:hypothetical protein
LMAALVCMAIAVPGQARTWRVERDGSGDYTVIQPAVDGAAPGDTVMIGPGRFEEHAPFTVPGWTEEVYVAVEADSLTITGSGADVTIIGPESPIHLPTERPKGIAGVFISDLSVQDLTIENIRDGIYRGEGHLEIGSSIFRGCNYGLTSWTDEGMLVDNCQFVGNIEGGLVTHNPAEDIMVCNSLFNNLTTNISFNTTDNAIVTHCEFTGGISGVAHNVMSSGHVSNCTFSGIQNAAINLAIGSNAVADSNLVIGGSANVYIRTNSHMQGAHNRFTGGTYATVLNSQSTIDLHGNHIFNAGGHTILLETFLDPPDVILDLTGNYWGTSEADSIDKWIWDGNDDPTIHAFVDFEPFSPVPIATAQKSWGGVKQLYR